MRIARYLARCGIASRRASEALIREERVSVNGTTITNPAFNVSPERDTVRFDDVAVSLPAAVYIALNKPPGYVTSAADSHAEKLVWELLPDSLKEIGLFTVGRLDKESEGLLLVTNDGLFGQRLMHPKYQIEKAYRVTVRGRIAEAWLRQCKAGIMDDDETLRAESVERVRQAGPVSELAFVLVQGKKREIRRLCRAGGLKVERLVRLRIGSVELGALKHGEWRYLEKAELEKL